MAGSKTSRGPVRGAGIPRLAGGETSQLARHLQENPTPSTFSTLQQGRLNAATHGSKTPKAEQARSRCSECIGLVMGPRGRGGLEFGGVVRGPNPNFQTKVQTTAATTTIPQAFVIQCKFGVPGGFAFSMALSGPGICFRRSVGHAACIGRRTKPVSRVVDTGTARSK